MSENTVKYTPHGGLPYFDTLPQGWRKAKRSDFYDLENRAIINKPALQFSHTFNWYYCHRTLSKKGVDDMMPFVDLGLVYVRE